MTIDIKRYHHIRLTVTDIEKSRKFYDDVFGLPVAMEVPDDADDETREQLSFLYGGVVYQFGETLFGLRPVADDSFNEDRCGLDHLSFEVESRDVLDGAARLLDELSIAHGDVKDLGGTFLLEFRDPDNIALELYAPNG